MNFIPMHLQGRCSCVSCMLALTLSLKNITKLLESVIG
uniref:Uncharacterized protein n=1 Tax=Arundo donax TaxID=35708 RepID=A0A0A9BTV5_ARUDO